MSATDEQRPANGATDEPADFAAWWEGLAEAPYYPGIERRIALHAWKSAFAAVSEPAAPVDALTDQQIAAIYQQTFNAKSDRKRDAPPTPRLVYEFARAVIDAALARQAVPPDQC